MRSVIWTEATLEMSLSDGSSGSFGSGGGDAVEGYVTDDGSYKLVGGVLGSAHNSYLGYFEPTYEFTNLNVWSPDSFSSDIMKTGETLAANSGLQSPNGMYKLFLQNDANLVIYDIYDRATWSSDTQNKCPNASPELVLQSDGNLVSCLFGQGSFKKKKLLPPFELHLAFSTPK